MLYVRTLGERNKRRAYGIDLARYQNGQYTVILSRPDLTGDFRLLHEIYKIVNQEGLPPSQIDEFLYIML